MARALVVDDEANIRELVGLYLQSAGFEVEHCADGEEAAALLAIAAASLAGGGPSAG
jgi:DNA-binding response OmpR family regulator